MRPAPRSLSALLGFFGLLVTRIADAEPPAAVVPSPPVAAVLSAPPPPVVDDPMLAPVPSPKRVVGTWAEAMGLLWSRSTNLKTALDQVLQAEGQTMVAFAQYLPALGGCAGGSSAPPGCGNATYTHQLLTHRTVQNVTGEPTSSVVPIPDTLIASLTLSQDLINVQEFDQIGINRLMEDQTHMTVEDTRRTLALSLATQIVSVVTAERSAEINRVGLRTALEQLELTKRRANLGAAMLLDVVRADQNAENARVALVNGDETLREARESLGLILGVPEETGVSREMNVDGLAQDAMGACRPVATVDERPDVRAAVTNVHVAKRNLQNTWYSFLPVITLQSSLSATSAVNAGYPNPTWSIGAALSLPIFDGGTRFGTLKSERAAQDIAEQSFLALERQDLIQVEQAERGIVVAQQSYNVALRQRALAAQNDTLTQALWSRGQGTSVDLVTASEAHRQAEQTLVVAEFGLVKARLAAVMALATCTG
ncbi:MAG TPA: TolC family protein [Polyangiaceae bacterium]|jgi:multidrug efflux system outer membrane protein|nr:TolC family protein [Polyangiaceae bacterium]